MHLGLYSDLGITSLADVQVSLIDKTALHQVFISPHYKDRFSLNYNWVLNFPSSKLVLVHYTFQTAKKFIVRVGIFKPPENYQFVLYDGPGIDSHEIPFTNVKSHAEANSTGFVCSVLVYINATPTNLADLIYLLSRIKFQSFRLLHKGNKLQLPGNTLPTDIQFPFQLCAHSRVCLLHILNPNASIKVSLKSMQYKGKDSIYCLYAGLLFYDQRLGEICTVCQPGTSTIAQRHIYFSKNASVLFYSFMEYAEIVGNLAVEQSYCVRVSVWLCDGESKMYERRRQLYLNYLISKSMKKCIIFQITKRKFPEKTDKCVKTVKPYSLQPVSSIKVIYKYEVTGYFSAHKLPGFRFIGRGPSHSFALLSLMFWRSPLCKLYFTGSGSVYQPPKMYFDMIALFGSLSLHYKEKYTHNTQHEGHGSRKGDSDPCKFRKTKICQSDEFSTNYTYCSVGQNNSVSFNLSFSESDPFGETGPSIEVMLAERSKHSWVNVLVNINHTKDTEMSSRQTSLSENLICCSQGTPGEISPKYQRGTLMLGGHRGSTKLKLEVTMNVTAYESKVKFQQYLFSYSQDAELPLRSVYYDPFRAIGSDKNRKKRERMGISTCSTNHPHKPNSLYVTDFTHPIYEHYIKSLHSIVESRKFHLSLPSFREYHEISLAGKIMSLSVECKDDLHDTMFPLKLLWVQTKQSPMKPSKPSQSLDEMSCLNFASTSFKLEKQTIICTTKTSVKMICNSSNNHVAADSKFFSKSFKNYQVVGFRIDKILKSWTGVQELCHTLGSVLPTFNSRTELSELLDLMKLSEFLPPIFSLFIGLKRTTNGTQVCDAKHFDHLYPMTTNTFKMHSLSSRLG